MTMGLETIITDLIAVLPNLAVALAALYWTTKRIDVLLEHQSKLVDELVEVLKENRAQSAFIRNGDGHPAKS